MKTYQERLIKELNTVDSYQERVIKEKKELDIKLDKLKNFISSEAFNLLKEEERDLMQKQHNYMLGYSFILGERIKLFKGVEN